MQSSSNVHGRSDFTSSIFKGLFSLLLNFVDSPNLNLVKGFCSPKKESKTSFELNLCPDSLKFSLVCFFVRTAARGRLSRGEYYYGHLYVFDLPNRICIYDQDPIKQSKLEQFVETFFLPRGPLDSCLGAI